MRKRKNRFLKYFLRPEILVAVALLRKTPQRIADTTRTPWSSPSLVSPARRRSPAPFPHAGGPLLGSPARRRSSPPPAPRPTPPPRCFPLLVRLFVPHGESQEGEGSIFVFDLLSGGGGLSRAWRAGAVPSRRQPPPRRLAGVDHEAGPRQFLHLAANLVHLAPPRTSLESAEALHFAPSAAATIPAFAAQQPALPVTKEQSCSCSSTGLEIW